MLCFELTLEVFWPLQFMRVTQQGNTLIEKNRKGRSNVAWSTRRTTSNHLLQTVRINIEGSPAEQI